MRNIAKVRRRFLLRYLSWLIVAIFVSSCVSTKKTTLLQEETVTDLSEEFLNQKVTDYKLQPGDHLYVRVFSVDPKTSRLFQTDMPLYYSTSMKELNSYKIDKDGYINFSFIDKIYVKGLTVDEARDLLQETINEYFKEATVIVKMVFYRVSVLGEVKNPGTFMVENKDINVLQAISEAGGIETFGNRKEVKLVRQTENGSKIYNLDLTDNGVLESEQFYLMPNDVVYVEPMNSKNIAFEKVPYSILISTITMSVAIYSIFK